jgi:hypothetical protein
VAGIRIQHPTARNVRYTVVESSRPYPAPYQCTPPAVGGCGSTHLFKTHHLNLDEQGACIVSQMVFRRIRVALEADGFAVANEVRRPPALLLGLDRYGRSPQQGIPILRSPNGREPI